MPYRMVSLDRESVNFRELCHKMRQNHQMATNLNLFVCNEVND
jgi:hypothetical protein